MKPSEFKAAPTRMKIGEMESRVIAEMRRVQEGREQIRDLEGLRRAISMQSMTTAAGKAEQEKALQELKGRIDSLTTSTDQHSHHACQEFANNWKVVAGELLIAELAKSK